MSMTDPDRVFMKDLKRLDKRLGCHFEEAHEHFVITFQRPFGLPIPLFMIEAEDGGFRQPDKRDLDRLYLSDTHREGNSIKQHLDHVTHYMEDYRARIRKQSKDNFRNMTKDDRIQLMNAFGKLYGGGKYNSAFRRIDVKSKGKKFKNYGTASDFVAA